VRREVALRPLTGSLRIATEPAEATVYVNDELRGPSPVLVEELVVNREHEIRAEMAGFSPSSRSMGVESGKITECVLRLEPLRYSVLFTSSPAGALIDLDGSEQGRTPIRVDGLREGAHRIRTALEGHVDVDSTVIVSEGTSMIHLPLVPESPGILVVQGELLARRIFIDESLWVENVHSSGPCTLSTGGHHVRVDLADTTLTRRIEIRPSQRTTYDYVRGEVQ
jgi:hypothetical protein